MPRVLARAIRLIKFGAVAGVAVGVGRMVMQRRRRPETGESSWPTIAETAAQNGQSVGYQSDEATSREAAAGGEGSDSEEAGEANAKA